MGLFNSKRPVEVAPSTSSPLLDAFKSNLGSLSIDADGKIVEANAKFSSLSGMDASSVIGTPYASLFENADKLLEIAKAEGLAGQNSVKRGGGTVYLDLIAIKDDSGNVTGFCEWSRPVATATAGSFAERQALVNAINRSQAVIFFNLDGIITSANENFCSAMGYAEDEIIGKHHRIFMDPEESNGAEYQQFWADLRQGKFKVGEFRRKNRQAEDIWINATYNPMFDDDGNPIKVVKFASDITANRRAVEALTNALTRLSDGDLSVRIDTDKYAALQEIHQNFNDTMGRLSHVITAIKTSTEGITGQTTEIQLAAGDMSNRTEGQAASLEETNAAMEEIATNVATNDETARVAARVAGDAASRAEAGSRIVADAVSAMTRIEESSSKITDIVSVIESIAFQTNLLALNAAVEAARAGEAGKGFAVVASEVRSLAQRASGAANDITGLIRDSVESVNEGATLVRNTGKSLEEINQAIGTLVHHVEDISDASEAQTSSIGAVSSSITSIDQSTQQNAQLADSFATNARRLNELVGELGKLSRNFQTGNEAQHSEGHNTRAVA